jgi:hypothetical protein
MFEIAIKSLLFYASLGLTAWWWGAIALLMRAQFSSVYPHGQWQTSPVYLKECLSEPTPRREQAKYILF